MAMIHQIRKAARMREKHDDNCDVALLDVTCNAIYVSGKNISTQSNLFSLLEFLIISYKYLRELHCNECIDCDC